VDQVEDLPLQTVLQEQLLQVAGAVLATLVVLMEQGADL
jgi:hypothetical protein